MAGIAALNVAAKYEEYQPPHIMDLVKITARAFSREDIMLMERKLLQDLEFNVTVVTPLDVLKRLKTLG